MLVEASEFVLINSLKLVSVRSFHVVFLFFFKTSRHYGFIVMLPEILNASEN